MTRYWVLLIGCLLLSSCDSKIPPMDTPKGVDGSTTSQQTIGNTISGWQSKLNNTSKGIIYSASLVATTADTSFGNPVSLTILCNQGSTELAINWGQHVPRGSKMTAYLQVGSQEFVNSAWRYLKDTETAYALQPQEILLALLQAEQLTARTTFFQGSIATAKFDLTGIERAVKDIRQACYW